MKDKKRKRKKKKKDGCYSRLKETKEGHLGDSIS